MFTALRIAAVLLFAVGPVFAQEKSALVATAAASLDGLRVTAPAGIVQMRIEVVSPGGTILYDSDWHGGNVLDWSPADLPYGSYRLHIFSKDLEQRISEKQTTLEVSADRITIDPALGSEFKLTTTAHDSVTGALITTSGDLSFRFGDYLNRKDLEAMRLTAEGNLDVKGWIRPAQGILFPDGSVLASAFVDESGRKGATRGSTNKKPKPEATGAGTTNQIAKWIDNAGTLGDSTVTELGGNVGIGTIMPTGRLHIFGAATLDVFAGMGVDMIAGPAFNFGYGGASFGRSAGFFNVRPDGMAAPPNPSLRFMTANVERMIITNTGDIGIGTSTPGGRFQIFAAPAADVFVGIGTDMTAGPSMNFGYGGATFGRGAGFFNARPDVMAVAPNPSLRFMTINQERMIITNTGDLGIGTSAPAARLEVDVASAPPVSSGPGINALTALKVVGGKGGNNTGSLGAGAGSNVLVQAGDGGDAGQGASGIGGSITLQPGVGGTSNELPPGAAGTVNVVGMLTVRDSAIVDQAGTSNGGITGNDHALLIGPSGAGITSKQTATGNQFGLDFFTGFNSRMSIANGGAVDIPGNLHVGGTLTKAAGSFRIDHPLDPQNRYLSHSFVESPDMKNIYDGVVRLDARGEATVELPDWFEALNDDFRYQLTAIGRPSPNLYVADEIRDNRFTIAGGTPGAKVSWMVSGIRHDAYANAHRIPVEELKSEAERRTP